MALPLLAIGASVLGNVLGGIFGGSDRKKAEAALARAQAIIDETGAPPETAKAIVLQQLQQGGVLTPETEGKVSLLMDEQQKLQERPENRIEQKAALDAIKQLSRTGLGLEDIAALNQARRAAQQDTQARSQQIMQQMAQRGQAGDGAELAMQIASMQQGAQQEGESAERVAGQAATARQQVIKDLFQGTSQLRNTDLDVAKTDLQNEQARRQFIDQNTLSRGSRNVDRENQARLANLQRQQGVNDANVQMANRELARQKEAQVRDYQNKLAYNQARAGQQQAEANRLMGNAASTQQSWSNIGQGIGSGLTSYGAYQQNNKLIDALGANKLANKQIDALGNFELDPSKNMLAGYAGRAHGGKIDGPEVVKGDHPANDIIPTMLSSGEIVIPKTKAKDPEKAKEFVAKVNKQDNKKNSKKEVLSSVAQLMKTLSEME